MPTYQIDTGNGTLEIDSDSEIPQDKLSAAVKAHLNTPKDAFQYPSVESQIGAVAAVKSVQQSENAEEFRQRAETFHNLPTAMKAVAPVALFGTDVLKTAAPVSGWVGAKDVEQNLRKASSDPSGGQELEENLGPVTKGVTRGMELYALQIPGAILKSSIDAYDQKYQETGSHKEATINALKTAPEMAAYVLVGKYFRPLTPFLQEESALVRGVAGAAQSSVGNIITSSAIRAIEAGNINAAQPTAESTAQDVFFGVLHGAHEGMQIANDKAKMSQALKVAPQELLNEASNDPQIDKTIPGLNALVKSEIARRADMPKTADALKTQPPEQTNEIQNKTTAQSAAGKTAGGDAGETKPGQPVAKTEVKLNESEVIKNENETQNEGKEKTDDQKEVTDRGGSTPPLRTAIYHDGGVQVGDEPFQAHDKITLNAVKNGIDVTAGQRGFVDDAGKFVNRVDAAKIALDKGMIDQSTFDRAMQRDGDDKGLHSEDLRAADKFAVGAMKAGELPPQETTGLKKATVKDERLARGLEDLPKEERQDEGDRVRRAEDKAVEKPQEVQKLITRIVDTGVKSITADEAADLLVERNRVMNERRDLEKEWHDPETDEARKKEVTKNLDGLEEQLNRLDVAQRAAGSEWGRTGRMYQRLIKEDYTLESMERRARIANDGKPLDAEQRATIKALSDQLAEAQKRVESAQQTEAQLKEQQEVTGTYQKLVSDLQKQISTSPRFDRRVLAAAENIVKKLESNAEAAHKRLRDRLGRTSAGVDPTIIKDVAEILAAKIARGGFEFADATAHLVDLFGEKIAPYVNKGWLEAEKLLSKISGDGKVRSAVRKGIKKAGATPEQVKSKAKAEAVAGEELSHKTVYDLAEAHVKAGVHGEDAVMKAVHNDLKEAYPDATERDIRRAFSEYGKTKFPSPDADKTELRELRTLVRLQESIDRLKENEAALKTGPQRDKATQAVREKQAQLNELLKTRQPPPTEEQLVSRDTAKQTALRNAIADLDKQLKTGEKPPAKAGVPDSPQTEQLRAERDAMRDKLNEIERSQNPALSPEERYNATRQKAIAKQISDIQERIKTNNYAKTPKSEPSAKNPETVRAWTELQKLKQQAKDNEDRIKNENRSTAQKVVDTLIKKPWHFLTAVKIIGHGTVGMVTHAGGLMWRPSQAATYWRNFGRQFGMWVNPAYHERLIYNLQNDPEYHAWKDAGASIDPTKTYTDYGMYAKWIGKLQAGGSRGFDALKLTLLELNKQDWKNVSPEIKADPKASLEARKEIAAINNKATGALPKGNDAVNQIARNAITNAALFAPKLYATRFTRVVLDPVKTAFTLANWKDATPAEKLAATTKLKHAGEFAATYIGALIANQAILSATGSKQNVNFTDPKKSDWLKFKAGDKTIMADGGLLDPVRLIGQIVWGDLIQNRTSNEQYREGTRYQKVTNDLAQYVRGKLNPTLGLVVDSATGSDFQGRPMPWSNEKPKFPDQPQYKWGEWLMQQGPIPLAGGTKIVYDSMRDKGLSHAQAMDIIKGAAVGLVGMTGVHVSTDYSTETKTKKRRSRSGN